MRAIDLLHRWCGGLVGLLLALIGASGTLLLHADALFRPVPGMTRPAIPLSLVVDRATRIPHVTVDYIIFASREFPFHRIVFREGAGVYLNRAGEVVSRWHRQWERPELWLFDFHRHLFSGKTGETIVGIIGLLGIGFVITGALLWWQRRRTFRPRLWPARMGRPAIVRHHRDLGILIAPLLLVSFVTGAAMAIQPVGLALVSPWSSASEIKAATSKPIDNASRPARPLDWSAILADAGLRFPAADIRLVSLPRNPGDAILVRMRQPGEWLPNGRTSLWYSATDGHAIEARDARSLPQGASILDKLYPIHAAKVGGLPYRLLLTISGLGLIMLGSFSVWTFWFKRQS